MATHNLRGTLACCQRASWRHPTTLEASLWCEMMNMMMMVVVVMVMVMVTNQNDNAEAAIE